MAVRRWRARSSATHSQPERGVRDVSPTSALHLAEPARAVLNERGGVGADCDSRTDGLHSEQDDEGINAQIPAPDTG